ncbi:MAG: EAL domain-containing protein [Cyanobacteria bacterium J06638_28]
MLDADEQLSLIQFSIEQVSDGVLWITSEGLIVHANRAVCHMLGYSLEELTQFSVTDIDPDVSPNSEHNSWEILKQQGYLLFETRYQAKDGWIFSVEVSSNYLEFSGEEYYVSIIRDISDRKAAEQELILKQSYLEALLNNIAHIAWIKDDQSRFIHCNESFSQACGKPAEELVDKTDYDAWPNELAQAYLKADFQILQSDQRNVVEERIALADGSLGWLETIKIPFRDVHGPLAGTVEIAADISDRKQAERLLADYNQELEQQVEERTRALQESEERLRLALSATNQGFFDLNLRTGEAIVSPEYAVMLGYDPATFHETEATWRLRLHPDDREQTHQAYRAYEAGQTNQYKAEFRLQTQQGDWKWILSIGQFIEWDETGQPTRLLGTHTDISDRKSAEIQLAAQNTLLAQIAQGQPLLEVLNSLIYSVERDLDGVLCSVLLLDKENRLRKGAAPSLPTEFNEAVDGLLIGEGVGSCGTAAFRNQTVIVSDIATDSLWCPYKDLALGYDLRACWSSPITARGGEVLGTFAMYYKQVRSPQTYELRVITQMAHIAGIAIERHRAEAKLRQSETNLLEAQRVAHVGNWEFDIASQMMNWSPEMFRIYGLEPSALAPSYQDYLQLIPVDARLRWQQHVERAIAEGIPYTLEYRRTRSDGLVSHHECRAEVEQDTQGQVIRIFGTTLDITELKQTELALQNLVAGTAATTGEDFFPALVSHISTALDVPIALVTQFVDCELQSLAFVVDGELQPNFTYNLPDTPCRDLVVDYTYHCPSDLAAHFPKHPHRDRGVDSYLGVALRDRQGQVLGSLCIFDRRPLQDPERAKQILNVFGSRAEAELERQRAENALQSLIEGTAALTGPDFFAALVRHLVAALNASHAFVTERIENDQLRFLAAWGDGQYLPNDVVDMEGTTCAEALRQGAYYCKRDVIACFPNNPRLAPMGVESYMGVALQNRQGEALGTLCVFARQPLPDPEHTEQILRVFAARAAAELERQRAEILIKQQFAAIEAAIDGISILQNGVYLYVNQAHLKLFGYEHADELVGQSWECLYSSDECRRFEQEILPQLTYGQGWQGEAIATRKDGSTFTQGVSLTLTEDQLLICVCRDISDLKQAQALIAHNALHDPLTALPNRTLLLERLELAMQRAQRYENYCYAVLFLDLDRFKVINDSLGHIVGDQLLVAIAQRLKTHLRQTDLVARLGGDEFFILLEDISSTEEVAQIAERILNDCQTPLTIHGHQIFTSISIGIVIGKKDYQQATDLIRDADIAMYQAKSQASNSYRFFDTEMHTEFVNRLTLETDMRRALDQQELTIYYQPIVNLANRQIVGFEALVRWQHPTRGLITPDEFIPIAEETGFISQIDNLVLHQACQQIVNWQRRFPEYSLLKISINLSAQDLYKPSLIHEIDKILTQTGLNGRNLTLEITESLLIKDIEQMIDVLMQLNAKKIQISIDDFGTGYSSLSYLHRLPVHSLKIDRSFVSQMEVETRNHQVVSTVITLGQQLGLTAIAEGIETPQQLQLLRKLGCQFGQGYLFSKPLAAQDIEACFFQSTGVGGC